MFELLKRAIEERICLEIYYPPGYRTVEPHALGYGSDGQILARVYQTSGSSASGEPTHWKLLRFDRMSNASDTGIQFSEPRIGYKRGDKAMSGGIIAEL
ncbi:WYL domain-containing protein [Pararhodobacter zhoushanensis]|uniref:WYL domain-containing protein n=1 Tax=Pararhodobacter zhoushanensis TaxID=2479545 RepID=A0ABT3GUD1_9RHOB|nr:WYL domain-containing protein [Pararhodobacter zhoushanensis]MCW1931158.1 WYL domain-containing protein [Pararhodobacter zhoushanensis]